MWRAILQVETEISDILKLLESFPLNSQLSVHLIYTFHILTYIFLPSQEDHLVIET